MLGNNKSKKKTNSTTQNKKALWSLILSASVIFGIIAYVIIRSSQFVVAVVPSQTIPEGTKVTSGMLKQVQVPANTPKGYITDTASLLGQKLKTEARENQLLYTNNVMLSWNDFSSGTKIPKDYVVTSVKISSDKAVSGMITSGDNVDIAGTPLSNYQTLDKNTMNNYLGGIADHSMGGSGAQVYWVLSNVKVLETDSQLSKQTKSDGTKSDQTSTNSNGSSNNDSSANQENNYIIALSYKDYRKLLLSQQYLELHMNITPAKGYAEDDIKEDKITSLEDAQSQSKYKEKKSSKTSSDKSSKTKEKTKNSKKSE